MKQRFDAKCEREFEKRFEAKIQAETEASKRASIIASEIILAERPFDYTLKLFAEGFVTAKNIKSEGEMVRYLFIFKFCFL